MFDGVTPVIPNPCLPCLALANPAVIPEPRGEVIYCGTMLELQHFMPDRSEARHSWSTSSAPHLFWSERDKALYAFPGVALPRKFKRGVSGRSLAAKAYKRWTGLNPTKQRTARAPRSAAATAGPATYILYRSDKWDPHPVNYVHPFDAGVVAYVGPGKVPTAFMVKGGRLRLTKGGLEG